MINCCTAFNGSQRRQSNFIKLPFDRENSERDENQQQQQQQQYCAQFQSLAIAMMDGETQLIENGGKLWNLCLLVCCWQSLTSCWCCLKERQWTWFTFDWWFGTSTVPWILGHLLWIWDDKKVFQWWECLLWRSTWWVISQKIQGTFKWDLIYVCGLQSVLNFVKRNYRCWLIIYI